MAVKGASSIATLYCRAMMSAPWGFRVSKRAVASFHIVTGGTCWLTVEGIDTPPVLLNEGDLVILPHGHAHTMTDHPQTPVSRLEELVPKPPVEKDGMVYRAGQGVVTALVCGGLLLEDHATNPLFSLLPPLLHMKSQHGQSHPWLGAIVQVVKAEASANQPAAKTVITRFSEILFLQAVRTYMGTVGDEKRGWFNALQDPQIGQALALIQHQPDEPWTVESLANHVSLSRSAFSAKFKQLVGQSPMQYVTRVRLTKAAALLRTNSATLVEVATSIGYDSEVAFSKAFRRYFGIAPGAYRQGKRPPTETATLENGYHVQ
jgi:AraC-like DNA-binding protein/mannose-6-phosphate isomerase-like protein (cupin superfamily)